MSVIYQLTFLLSAIISAYVLGWSLIGYVFKTSKNVSSKPFLIIAAGLAWIVTASAWALLISRMLPFYIYLQYTIVFIPVFVAILLRGRAQGRSTIKQHVGRLLKVSWLFLLPTLILMASGIISSMHHKVQFGVDSSLYIQTAHHLIRSPNNPTDVWNLVETGNLAWSAFVQSHRWGLPLLVQFFTSDIFDDLAKNSYSICSLFIVLPAGLIVENIPAVETDKKPLSNIRTFLMLSCVMCNWFLFYLLLEGQWPNLVALTFYFLASIFIIDLLDDTFNPKPKKSISLEKILLSALFFSAACTIYGEFLLLHLMSLCILCVVMLVLNIRVIYSTRVKGCLIFLRTAFLTVTASSLFCLPYLQRALVHTSTLQLQAVGYPQPRPLLIQDILGIDSPWILDDWHSSKHSWTEAVDLGVNRLFDTSEIKYFLLLALIGLCVLSLLCINCALNAFTLSNSKYKIFNTLSLFVPAYALVATAYALKTASFSGQNCDYIWLKLSSYLFLFVQFIVLSSLQALIVGECGLDRSKNEFHLGNAVSLLFLSLYSLMITFTCIFYLNAFEKRSAPARILSQETQKKLAIEYSDCIILLPPRGLSKSARRWADRTKEFIIRSTSPNSTSSTRSLRFLDSWGFNVSHYAVSGQPLSMHGTICLLLDTKGGSYDQRFIKDNHVLMASQRSLPDDWTLYVTDYSFGDLERIGRVDLYSKLYSGMKN